KASYTVEMLYAMEFVKSFEKTFSVKVSEDEIGFLVLYFALGNYQQQTQKKAIIICNYGIGTSQLIKERVIHELPSLNVIGVYPQYYLDALSKQDLDLIITTVPLDDKLFNCPIFVIDNLLSEDGFKDLKEYVSTNNFSINPLINLTNKSFFHKLDLNSKEAVLNYLYDDLKAKQLITSDNIKALEERELMAATDIGNLVAIPHVLILDEQVSSLSIVVLDKPIIWQTKPVSIVFLTILNQKDLKDGYLFRWLYLKLKDIQLVNNLIKAQDYESFITSF
ncbi:MAG: PTS sugar transporter subunit IIA, partial [Bacilli bacterium]